MQEKIITTIKNILERLGITHERIEEKEVGGQEFICIHTQESGRLIGQRGDVLRALNTLIGHLVERDSGERMHVTIDVNDYRAGRIEKVITEARTLAQRARDLRYDVEMQPSTSYERLIVHKALAGESDVQTSSVGEGQSRRIVIKWVG